MRYIPYKLSSITFPSDWKSKATHARASVAKASLSERSDVIKDYQSLWKDLKPELARLSYDKCWYTEAPQAGTDIDVDHFRPKNSVHNARRGANEETHPGYWWRAFDPANFRLSCIMANRRRHDVATGHTGGKADEFPLQDETKRAWRPEDECDDEQPLLLDPCDPFDVTLVTFSENGEAIARYSASDKPWFNKRAEVSIDLYHLNHSMLRNARISMRDMIEKLIEDAKRYFKKLDGTDPDLERAYKRAIELLREARSPGAPYSIFAESIMEPHKFEESLRGVFQS